MFAKHFDGMVSLDPDTEFGNKIRDTDVESRHVGVGEGNHGMDREVGIDIDALPCVN